jgi:hypothetical protein
MGKENAADECTRRICSRFPQAGAEDGIRTRDLLLGKEMLYH